MRQIESARIRDEEMAKIRMAEQISRKRLADLKSIEPPLPSPPCPTTTAATTTPKLERTLSLKVKTKLDIVMDKNMIKEEIRAARELEQRLLEEKARKVAEEKYKRDSIQSKYSSYNIDYLKDRYLIKERRLIEENEKLEQLEMAKQKARERARIRAQIQAQHQAELESSRLVNETSRLNDEQQAARLKSLEEQMNLKLTFQTLTNCNHRYLIDDIERTATLRAIEDVKHEMTIKPDSKLDVFKEKAIRTAMKQQPATMTRRPTTSHSNSKSKNSKSSLRLSKSFVVPSFVTASAASQTASVQPVQENKKIKAALDYLASIEDFLIEQQMINNPSSSTSTSSSSKGKYGSTGDYLKERRILADQKMSKEKQKIDEENARKLRAEARARKRLETDVRKQIESDDGGDLYYDNYKIECFFDKF